MRGDPVGCVVRTLWALGTLFVVRLQQLLIDTPERVAVLTCEHVVGNDPEANLIADDNVGGCAQQCQQ